MFFIGLSWEEIFSVYQINIENDVYIYLHINFRFFLSMIMYGINNCYNHTS